MKFDLNSPDLELLESIEDPEELFKILVDIMRKLRSREGCLWDREQDHLSLKKSLIEEAYETAEAIDGGDMSELREELGDLLLQVVFHGQIAEEDGSFKHADIIKGIIKKLLRRHPHVFADASASSSQEILESWEDIKKKERKESNNGKDSIFSGIPRSMPALHYAHEIQSRASRLGFDWDRAEDVFKKIAEEMDELERETSGGDMDKAAHELGDLIFSVVNYGRHLGIDVEASLKGTCRRFITRFKLMEEIAAGSGRDFKELPLEEKDRLWEEAKRRL